MIISEKICNSITVIAIQGMLDASSARQLKNYSSAAPSSDTIIIDLSEVDFLDSSGLGALVGMARKQNEAGGNVTLACMNDKVRKVFEITQVYRLFNIYDDVDAAAINAEKTKNSI